MLKNLRMEKSISLRKACQLTGYDPSNWSKIERGILSPPSEDKVLSKWATTIGLKKGSSEFNKFIDEAKIAQGIIPEDILSQNNLIEYLPAFFRTLRNKKPTKSETKKLIDLISNR